jgi:hypothetical protein
MAKRWTALRQNQVESLGSDFKLIHYRLLAYPAPLLRRDRSAFVILRQGLVAIKLQCLF